MDIRQGYKIENPSIIVPMRITPGFLKCLFAGHPLKMIAPDYFVAECTSLSGLKHNLGFHFSPIFPWAFALHRRLCRLEFFRTEDDPLQPPELQARSFADFQTRLETAFGSPTKSTAGSEGFPNHEWLFDNITVRHSVYERFVLSEGVGIYLNS